MSDSLEVRSLNIRRGGRWLVQELTWTVPIGKVAWIHGENGAGKSTLLRILAGILSPDAGSVRLGAEAPRRSQVAYYHPGMGIVPGVRVGSWLRLFADDGSKVGEALRADWVRPGALTHELSTGEQKRLLLEPLVARSASLVLLDEPYGHLSPDGKEVLTGLLLEKARNAVVIVSTNQRIPVEVGSGPSLHLDGSGAEIRAGRDD